MIIGLGYRRRAGKDTVADILVKKYGFIKMSFTIDGGLQDACVALNPIVDMEVVHSDEYGGYWKKTPIRYADVYSELGYEGAKDKYPEVVRTLQRMGTEVGRNIIDPDVWVNIALSKCYEGGGHYVFTNCRFANEVAAIRKAGGVPVHVDRPGLVLNDPEDIAVHESELAVGIEWDYTITNDGTLEDLERAVGRLMWSFGTKLL
jgi:hypothetical protein